MNISHDEYGPVDVDALMVLHNEKMKKESKSYHNTRMNAMMSPQSANALIQHPMWTHRNVLVL